MNNERYIKYYFILRKPTDNIVIFGFIIKLYSEMSMQCRLFQRIEILTMVKQKN